MNKVLVTGASGFIGRRLALFFLEKQYEVVGWNRIREDNVFPIESVDMSSIDSIEKELSLVKPDIIIHCAGSADVGKSVKNPEMDFQGNVVLTHNLLFAMHRLGMKDTRFVFLSSAGVYGNPKSLPITEDIMMRSFILIRFIHICSEEIGLMNIILEMYTMRWFNLFNFRL